MGVEEQLRAMHDSYVWEVNAAIGEDRLDLVWHLADEFTDRALALMTADEPSGCEKADCVVCHPRGHLPEPPPRRGLRRWMWGRRV